MLWWDTTRTELQDRWNAEQLRAIRDRLHVVRREQADAAATSDDDDDDDDDLTSFQGSPEPSEAGAPEGSPRAPA
jgi:hypothetical protein